MRVVTRARLRRFWEARKGGADSARLALLIWEKIARNAKCENWAELKQVFGSADRVGNCTVFDVGNKNYRLIARVVFEKGRIFVLKVMDHKEYDQQRWVESCRCHQPPPRRR